MRLQAAITRIKKPTVCNYRSIYRRLRRDTKMTNEGAQLKHVVVENGTIKNPIDRNPFFMKVELIVSIVGILMNILIAFIIIFNKHLMRTKPRNIFLLGLVFSNLSASVPVFMEFSYLISPSQELCQAYVAINGLPFVLFLTNLLLALVDGYAAIVHPLWHKEKVTVRLAVFSQLGASIFISVIYKFAYIAQFIPLNCEMQLIQIKIITIIFLILFSSCIVLQITVYRRTREILVNYGRSNSGSASIPELLDVHISESSINRLEIEATTTLIASVTSLSLVTGPLYYTLLLYSCVGFTLKTTFVVLFRGYPLTLKLLLFCILCIIQPFTFSAALNSHQS